MASTELVRPKVVQDIVVVCTDKEANAPGLMAIARIGVSGKEHEAAVYVATEGNYINGVICNIERDIADAELVRLTVHRAHPTIRGAKGIRETGFVIVLFAGEEVPRYVRARPAIVRCYLYKKQIEVCNKCP